MIVYLNECTYHQTLSTITLFLSPTAVTKFQGETLSTDVNARKWGRDFTCMGWEKFAIFDQNRRTAFISETVRDRSIDGSLTGSRRIIIGSDARRNAIERPIFFRLISAKYARTYRLTYRTKFGRATCGGGTLSRRSTTPPFKGRPPAALSNFGEPPTYAHKV